MLYGVHETLRDAFVSTAPPARPIPNKDIGQRHFLFIPLIYNKDVLSHFRPSIRIFIRTKDDTEQYGSMRLSRYSIPRCPAIKRFIFSSLFITTHPLLIHATSGIFFLSHFFLCPSCNIYHCCCFCCCLFITHHHCLNFQSPKTELQNADKTTDSNIVYKSKIWDNSE